MAPSIRTQPFLLFAALATVLLSPGCASARIKREDARALASADST